MDSNKQYINLEFNQMKCTCSEKINILANTDRWQESLNQLKQQIYNSTKVGIPTVPHHLKKSNNTTDTLVEKCSFCKKTAFLKFNANPFGSNDVVTYRKQRSEHLIFRMIHNFDIKIEKAFLRIDSGVFIAQHTKPNTYDQINQFSQTSMIEAFLNDVSYLNADILGDITPVFTFDQNNIPSLITNVTDDIYDYNNNHSLMSPSSASLFTQFSYTMGIRYTKINQCCDALIQGSIPMWCQTLILHEYYSTEPPVKPNETRYGLIPFATHIPLYFQPFLSPDEVGVEIEQYNHQKNKKDDATPELLVLYEKLNMELTSSVDFSLDKINSQERYKERNEILRNVLCCFISPDYAQLITSLANEWAEEKGYIA
ncbi:unnamed protein product [Cunninghamella blakesleeana]